MREDSPEISEDLCPNSLEGQQTKIRTLIEKTKHYDKDERQMATSDLKNALGNIHGQIDPDLQTPIRDAVLSQLDDGSTEVQNIAVSCLSAIVLKFKPNEIYKIANKLGQSLIEGMPEMRDSYADGLKTIISSVEMSLGSGISSHIIDHLLNGLSTINHKDLDKANFCLDVLECLLQTFGSMTASSHKDILECLTQILENENSGMRKRAAAVLASLVLVLDDELFHSMITGIIKKIGETKNNKDKLRNYIQTIGVVGRNAGVRIGKYLNKIVPLLVKFCKERVGRNDEETIILRENCLAAFESLILECPSGITPHIDSLVNLAIEYISYDPNQQGPIEISCEPNQSVKATDDDPDAMIDDDGQNDEEQTNADIEMNEQGDAGDFGGDMVQEDDYEAWRVRRASVKVISAFISTASSSLLFEKFDNICWILVSRFIDRDVDVKIEVFHSIRNLMSSTVRKTGNGCLEFDQPQLTRMPSLGLPPMVRAVSTAVLLETHISKIIEEILKQIDKGDVSTKSAAYSVIREICIVRNGTLENWFNHIFECLSLSMKERDAAVRSKALDLLALLFEYHPSKFCTPVIPIVSQPIADAITDRTTRLKVQGLHCCEIIARIMRPNFDEYLDSLVSSLQFLYSKALEEMRQIDIEQNARIAALSAVSEILSRFGDVFNDTLPTTLSIFHERLLNQTTRISALKAFTKMCNSPIKIDMSSIKSKAIDTIVSFLKRSTQEVTHEAATALNSLLLNDYGGFDLPIIPDLLEEVSDFICDEDLFLAHLVLDIIATMIKNEIIPKIPRKIIDKCFNLLKSPLIQGSDALQSLQQVFFAFLQCQTESSFNYQTLLNDIISLVNSDLSVESYTSISKCAAYIAIRTDEINQKETIERFISDVDCKEKPKAHIALLCLGEIGRVKDFSKTNSGNVVFDAFKRESREIKSAASFALGCISISNLNYYLMDLLSKIEKYPKFRYLLLSSLKEIISFHTNSEKLNDLRKHSEKIIPILLENSKTNDEGEKAIISECLGKLVIIDYNKTIPKIEQNLQNKNSEVRATMIASVKFALCGDKQVQEVLRNKMDQFLKLLNDNEIQGQICDQCEEDNAATVKYCSVPNCKAIRPVTDVERQAFLMCDAVMRHDVQLVSSFLRKENPNLPDSTLLLSIYSATQFHKEYVKEMDLGAVKVRRDLGLLIRKSAFQCMETLVTYADHWLSFPSYINSLSNGLFDPDGDILQSTYQIFARLARSHGAEILNELDGLPEKFIIGLKSQLKITKGTGNEADQAKNVLLSSVEALFAICAIPGCKSLSNYQKFYRQVLATPLLKQMLVELEKGKDNFNKEL